MASQQSIQTSRSQIAIDLGHNKGKRVKLKHSRIFKIKGNGKGKSNLRNVVCNTE